jgi:hypothetical protein
MEEWSFELAFGKQISISMNKKRNLRSGIL